MKEWLEGALASASNHKHTSPYGASTEQCRAWVKGYNDHAEGKIRVGWWNCQAHGETRQECKCGAATNFLTKVPGTEESKI